VAAIVAAGCLVVAGCGQEERGMNIDWDLSSAHTRAEVEWPEKYRDAYTTQLEPVESVRIRLPAGEVVRMPDRASDIILYRRAQGPEPLPGPEGEILEKLEVYSEPMDVEDAYRRALAYADQFDRSRAPIDAWRERRERGVDPVTDRTATGSDQPLGGKGGPFLTVELNYSSNDDRPWIPTVRLYWPPPREA